MPITVDALQAALTAGVREFRPIEIGWGDVSVLYDQLMVGIFGSAVTTAQSFNDSDITTSARFTVPATTGAAAPNFQVKSYLDKPVVCDVATSGTVQKIAFVLTQDDGDPGAGPGQSPTTFSATDGLVIKSTASGSMQMGYGNEAPIPPENLGIHSAADVFMVITVDPGVPVTTGGYLTVKGYASGVSGSDSFTYVTLQSGT